MNGYHKESLNLKKNRSRKFTKGITVVLDKQDPLYSAVRFFFFETDSPFNEDNYSMIVRTYEYHNLDLLVHRTGGGGLHFLSPTYISIEKWREIHKTLKYINTKCPMTTLRFINNKYPDEISWFTSKAYYNNPEPENNSREFCNLLNHTWNSNFKGAVPSTLGFVHYPLPETPESLYRSISGLDDEL